VTEEHGRPIAVEAAGAGGHETETAKLAAARTLLLDAVAVEGISLLRAHGIRAILLKGPVTARWLYPEPGTRDYVDVDLLVPGAEFPRAAGVFENLGFRDVIAELAPNETYPHAHELILDRPYLGRGGVRFPAGVAIDLHWSVHGVGAPDEELWDAVVESAERVLIAGVEVEVPGEPMRALLLALHAAVFGVAVRKPLVDLDRGLERLSDQTWTAAYGLAVRLDAVPRFLTGLATRPCGVALIDRLELEGRIDVMSALRLAGIPPVSGGIERLRQTSGLRSRAALIARELVPTRSFMRTWSPIARRGPAGLALAHAYRPFWLLAKLPAALRAHADARRVAAANDLPGTRREPSNDP
jgi:hypothetical protein